MCCTLACVALRCVAFPFIFFIFFWGGGNLILVRKIVQDNWSKSTVAPKYVLVTSFSTNSYSIKMHYFNLKNAEK